MANKHKSKKAKHKEEKVVAPKKRNKSMGFLVNFVLAALFIFGISYLTKNQQSSKWINEKLIGTNLGFIKKYGGYTRSQKLEAKLRMDYSLMKNIMAQTADSAIILFPLDTVALNNPKLELKGYVKPHERILKKEFLSYFIYPREIRYFHEIQNGTKDKNGLTHLAIVDNRGYELVPQYKGNKIANGLMRLGGPAK